MLREQLNENLKIAMKARRSTEVSTLRLILAALKDRDIAARGKGDDEGISDGDILGMLQSMIKQRRESIIMYEKGGRVELAEQEALEIEIIQQFLPVQLSDDEATAAVAEILSEFDAQSLKDMGRVMGGLRDRYAGRMDFAKAGAAVKAKLS